MDTDETSATSTRRNAATRLRSELQTVSLNFDQIQICTTSVRQRLDSLSLGDVEAYLRTTLHPYNATTSVLDCLHNSNSSMSQAEIAKHLLEFYSDRIEDHDKLVTYVELRAIWLTHPNTSLHSADSFLASLEHWDRVKLGLVLATSTEHAKASALTVISDHWGADWLEQLPVDVRPVLMDNNVLSLSKRMLQGIAATCRESIPISHAVEKWRCSIKERTDVRLRRHNKICGPYTPGLILSDVQSTISPSYLNNTRVRRAKANLPDTSKDQAKPHDIGLTSMNAAAIDSTRRHTPRVHRIKAAESIGQNSRNESSVSKVKFRLNAPRQAKSPPLTRKAAYLARQRHRFYRQRIRLHSTEVELETAVDESIYARLQSIACHGHRLAWLLRLLLNYTTDLDLERMCCKHCKSKMPGGMLDLNSMLNKEVSALESITSHPGLDWGSVSAEEETHEEDQDEDEDEYEDGEYR